MMDRSAWWLRALAMAIVVALYARAEAAADGVFCPTEWERSLIFAQSFDGPDGGRPETVATGIQLREKIPAGEQGMRGRCGTPDTAKAVVLAAEGTALSPHQPLSVLFWWSLREDLPGQGGFNLVQMNGRGMIAHFARGGPWCGLKETAGVVQVYYLPGIGNVNGIYDPALHRSLGLRRGEWHHTALVISAGSLVTAYTDGKPVFETRNTGRRFSAEDGFRLLTIGGGLALDEIMVLNRPLPAEQIAEYVRGLRQIRQAYDEGR